MASSPYSHHLGPRSGSSPSPYRPRPKVAEGLAAVVAAVLLGSGLFCVGPTASLWAQQPIPHGQDRPPGPPLSPEEALAKMTVPEGFHVELVASEPDLVNPIAMAFDEQGRIWVTESLEYPRKEPGPGRDRIKVLEDTDNDGRADRFTVFADGLNIPSGIAIGHGGVWVSNAPDILFLEDTDGDLKADKKTVVVTGFGRDDTHELPNSLTWGPDGYLYGLNGVFNHCHVRQDDRDYRFTCAMFRIDPRTHRFELFAEGTSNPWGIAFNGDGAAFVSACVIDHLWHLTETGYYHRQAGAYPPYTWKIESIVDHRHQKAAYCGITWFDSDAYPEEYRGRLYMGNIHGNCINVDALSPNGSTYRGTSRPDFLSANDAWFMPVAQRTGPDGCLYVLDWYDRYHCYQDARRDPEGIDRGKGRLYRIRYGSGPRPEPRDLGAATPAELVALLDDPNVYVRTTSQRLLSEQADAETRSELRRRVVDGNASVQSRRHAFWALLSARALDEELQRAMLDADDPVLRAWAVRAAGDSDDPSDVVRERLVSMSASESDPAVLLQIAIASAKMKEVDALPILVRVAARCGEDPLIPHIVWQNLHPHLEDRGDAFLAAARQYDLESSPGLAQIMPRALERILDTNAE